MRSARLIAFLYLFAAVALAQAPRIQTVTRFVTIFSNLENQLMDALVANNTAGASRLLADDFSQWTPNPPGDPTPREAWIRTDRRDMADFRIRQMSVKETGDRAVANFVLTAMGKAWFVVDVWRKNGSDWQLESRYLSPIDPAPFRGPVKPTGKD